MKFSTNARLDRKNLALPRPLGPFEHMKFTDFDMYKCRIMDVDELKVWIKLLCDEGKICSVSGQFEKHIETDPMAQYANPFEHHFKLTPEGWDFLESNLFFSQSKKVFIAMSFGIEGRPHIQQAIAEACEICGFNATTVDLEEFQGGITDKIISMINEAKFTICDFTENKRGVYYEAGYSEGLGKTTIYTVRDGDDVKKLHFDTMHLNHIVWSDPEDLKDRLIDRIKAVVVNSTR